MTRPILTLLIVDDFPADRELYWRSLLADSSCAYCFLAADCALDAEDYLVKCRLTVYPHCQQSAMAIACNKLEFRLMARKSGYLCKRGRFLVNAEIWRKITA